MKSFQKKAMQFKDRQTPPYSMTVASSKLLTTTKNAMVGFDDELLQLMDTLTGHQSSYKSSRLLVWEELGFLKPNEAQSLEEVVEDYLKDLIDRNLVLVSSRKLSGRIKYSKMHDLVREVCSRIGEKEKFIYVIMELDTPPGIDRLEHCIVHYNRIPQNLPEVFSALPSASLVRTFKFEGGPLPFKFQLLRVLTCVDIFESPEDIFQHVNLCYLSHEPHWCLRIKPLISQLPYSLFQLWNVQTLSFNLENVIEFLHHSRYGI
ncbi:hypothetical protein ACS0TY_007000 [Phlomoides rotata]